MSILFENATVLDVMAGKLVPGRHLLVIGNRIERIADRPIVASDARRIDVRGKVIMPGLCDAHVHVTAVTADFAALGRMSPTYVAAGAATIMRKMLMRGFTTIRDAGGADYGLARAIEEGTLQGPRLLYCGRALSQTGGHGDMRGPGESGVEQCFCCAGLGRICDGVSEVRRAARDEIRKGANHIKIMASGGVSSPTDRITSTQFSSEEMNAVVEEAAAANIYVMAHAYTPRAIIRAVRAGVRSVEHGNLLDEESANCLAEAGAFLVPTIITTHALAEQGTDAGLPQEMREKIFEVRDAGLQALQIAHRRGVRIAFGSDLLGALHDRQSEEFLLRAEVQMPVDIIRGATCNAAELFQMAGEIGVIAEGARADLLVVDGNPLEDIRVLVNQGERLRAIMKDGIFYKDELG